MKIEIEIPKEFEGDWESDRFEDFFERALVDMNGDGYGGNYERETAKMFICAFKNGIINNQPQVHQWIPCSERLPEDLNDKNIDCFLVTDGFLIWMAYYNSEIGWQFAECTNSRNKIDWTEIIAWQPLPSVWKGENNAEK